MIERRRAIQVTMRPAAGICRGRCWDPPWGTDNAWLTTARFDPASLPRSPDGGP